MRTSNRRGFAPPVTARTLHYRLSVLMFLQYAAPGAVVPIFSLRMQELGFTPVEIGWLCAPQALAALVAPLVAGQVADRCLAADRCLVACSLAASVLLWVLAACTTLPAVFAATLAFWLVMTPIMTLGVALSFARLPAPEQQYGGVRLWGTVGWIVPGWLLGLWLANSERLMRGVTILRGTCPRADLSDAFRLGGVLALALGVYALTLPRTPPQRRIGSWLAPLAAMSLLRGRALAVYCLCMVGWCVTLPFATQTVPLLLDHLGVPQRWLAPALTVSQGVEVLALAVLPVFLLRFGVRGTMLLGLGAWTTGLLVLMVGWPLWLVVGIQGTQGLCICCFPVAGQVFVNGLAHGDVRVSAQGLLTVANGLGQLIGNLLAGWVRRQVGGDFALTFGVAGPVAFLVGFPADAANPTAEGDGCG
jgi:MFS family permease